VASSPASRVTRRPGAGRRGAVTLVVAALGLVAFGGCSGGGAAPPLTGDAGTRELARPSVPDACRDGVRDGHESDVDCGGDACPPCFDGAACASRLDCAGGDCVGSPRKCITPSCRDFVKDGKEADVDCGGPCPAPCLTGRACRVDADCASRTCAAGTCAATSCQDGVMNGDETGVDCGGAVCPACVARAECASAADCPGGACKDGVCVAVSCTDGARDGNETDVDCGGGAPCLPCDAGAACATANDCASLVCTALVCAAPSCTDGVKNGTETDYDCGGGCPHTCLPFQGCNVGADCRGGDCDAAQHVCRPSCTDGLLDGAETDLDCGGPCAPCRPDRDCNGPADCTTALCSFIGHGLHCRPLPSCANGARDGGETGIDCGGPTCSACAAGGGCVGAADCQSGVCATGVCAP
jgi:hypothetical protein